MSTIPCKYFLRNQCRFGDNCRFYHSRVGSTIGNPAVSFGSQNLASPNFNAPQQHEVINLSAKSQQNMDAMAEMVKKDMIEWDYGKIWPFSSYGPAGSKPCLPGFEDISQEELRYQYLQNNNTPPDLSQQMKNHQQARLNYQQTTPAVRNILERVIVKGEKITDSTLPGSWGGGGGAFGGSSIANPATSGFQTQASGLTTGFGMNNSSFSLGNVGAMNQPNIDGMESAEVNPTYSASQQQSNSGLFSSQPKPQSQGFGGFSFSQSFGTSQAPQQQSQPFVQSQQLFPTSQLPAFGQAQPQAANIFQSTGQVALNQASPFQSSQLQGLLQSQPQQHSNAFQANSSQPQPSILQQPQQPTTPKPFSFSLGDSTSPAVSTSPSVFGGTFSQPTAIPTNSIFGAPPNQTVGNSTVAPVSSTPSVFGGTFSQPTAIPPMSSIFGAPPNQTSTAIFGQQQNPNMFPAPIVPGGSEQGELRYAYSEESDLTPEELEAFKAGHFTLENIPVRPPPRAYCGM